MSEPMRWEPGHVGHTSDDPVCGVTMRESANGHYVEFATYSKLLEAARRVVEAKQRCDDAKASIGSRGHNRRRDESIAALAALLPPKGKKVDHRNPGVVVGDEEEP